MRSPFPGMDPYLEAHWGDVHTRLIIYASDQLQSKLPEELRARVEERVFVESEVENDSRSIYPDVRVVERPNGQRPLFDSGTGGIAVAIAEPVVVRMPDEMQDEVKTETFIEIRDASSGGRVVTVIEFVSPSNKMPGKGRDLYRRRQLELETAHVNSVEIDLLRAGNHVISCPLKIMPANCRGPYRISVQRATEPDAWEVYPVSLREPLPTIRIPLRETDPDVPLNLQALIDQCYLNGNYGDIDYGCEPEPKLDAGDAPLWQRKLGP
ncbi:MAG: DUF4058 family protein [Pirellulales bacterium]